MPVQQFRQLLQLVTRDPNIKRASGPVESAQTLLKPETLAALDAGFRGGYGLVIHDPLTDASVHAYLTNGSLAADSGKTLLILYEPQKAPSASAAPAPDSGIGAIEQSPPLVDFVRGLFPGTPIVLPGIVFLPRLSAPGDPLYVPLGASGDAQQLATAIRDLLAIVGAHVDAASLTLDVDGVGRALAIRGLGYSRAERRSPAELLLKALRAMWDMRRDLAALVSGGMKLTTGRS